MNLRLLTAAAVLATVPLAHSSAFAQAGSIELQVQATVTIPPDRISLPITIRATGKTEAEARAALDEQERDVRKELATMGFKPAEISVSKPGEFTQQPDYDACIVAAAAGAAADAAAPAPTVPRGADIEVSAGEAAQDAARVSEIAASCELTQTVGVRSLVISPSDASQELKLYQTVEDPTFQYGKGAYAQSNPAAAKRKAREQALAQARQEADLLADGMGYRITGIKRISTAPAPMSMDGIIRFLAEVDGPGRKRGPEWYAASVSQTVTIDFIAVPK